MPSDFDRQSADIPIWGWLSGAQARRDAELAAEDRQRERGEINTLRGQIPGVDDLSVEYSLEGRNDEYGDLLGGPSQLEGVGASDDQTAAMAALQSLYQSGGYTDADRSAGRAMRSATAQQVGGMNRAALAAQEARGGGGSGAALASQLAGGQAMANASVQGDAAIQQAAMQRAFGALQGYQSGANTMQSQELARRQALDSYNQSGVDWRRGRQERNTSWQNRGLESQGQALRDQFGMRERAQALSSGQYAGASGDRLANGQRQDAAGAAGAGVLGGIISEIF